MTFAAFVRHGQTDWNRDDRMQGSSDIPLNDTGREQAQDVIHALGDRSWDVVVSSPLLRARETAEIVAASLGVELGPSYPEFAERSYGSLEGANATECITKFPGKDYPDAEPLASVVQRGLAGLAHVHRDYRGRDVIIVCHGTIIRYTLASLAGHAVDGIGNGTVSEVEYRGGHWRVLTVNGIPIEDHPDRVLGDRENA